MMEESVWLCKWNDAWMDFDEPDELEEVMPVHTVGFLVRDTEHTVTLAAERFPEGGYRCLTSIPRPLVTELRQL